jgi:hypothetical protein
MTSAGGVEFQYSGKPTPRAECLTPKPVSNRHGGIITPGQGRCVVMKPSEMALIFVFIALLVVTAIGFFFPELLPF